LLLKRVPVEVRAVVDSALETIATQLRETQHRLHVDVSSHGLAVIADPVRRCQVFANLLANAVTYAEPGGDILVSARTASASIRVSVRDSGVEIRGDALPRVLDMFEQAEESLVRAEGGLGIGLALVRAIAELHGGVVTAVSQGLGTIAE
jgi:signal transduction histidine kinase